MYFAHFLCPIYCPDNNQSRQEQEKAHLIHEIGSDLTKIGKMAGNFNSKVVQDRFTLLHKICKYLSCSVDINIASGKIAQKFAQCVKKHEISLWFVHI